MSRITRRAKNYLRRGRRAVQFEAHAYWRRRPVRRGTVLYESFSGNGMLCNPEAIFRELLASPDFRDFEHIWAISDFRQYRSTIAEFAHTPNVKFVHYRSQGYFRALATSEYLVNNATFPFEFSKREGQKYINTWHGTPLKKMGYDMEDGAMQAANILRNFVQADYLLSANPFMTETMYESAYRLKHFYNGTIIEEGYPRIDRQLLDQDQFLAVRARLEKNGVQLGSRNIVLYAPTWKGDSFSRPEDDIAELVDAVKELQRTLGEERYVVLLKTHQIVARYATDDPELRRILVPNEIPTNVVLGLSSALVTDYSSIFFDYLATGRPIAFYTPDMDDYSGSRGLYFPPKEWPGPVCTTMTAVGEQIAKAAADGGISAEFRETYEAWQNRFTATEDGSVTKRVVDVVFRGKRDGYRLCVQERDDRTSILLYLGGMRSNGITASALNLLNTIDHEKLDVTAVFAHTRRGQAALNQTRINPAVRQFPRLGGMNGSKITQVRRKFADLIRRPTRHKTDATHRSLWQNEWTRVFGDSRFDLVVDFSGYSAFWARLLLHSPQAFRSIWMHNDMASEKHRKVNGRKRLRRGLSSIFTLYSEFDHLVSVSPALEAVNRRTLAEYAKPELFTSARNLLDAEHVISGATQDLRELAEHPRDPETDEVIMPEWVEELRAHDGTIWFVTVGRYSPEKNQRRLLNAFAEVHAQRPETRLLLVGYGPLRDDLEDHIASLKLQGVAHLVGPYSNPFAIVARADCFVLSSNYEGQPMVLLEAAALGRPLVSVDFSSVHATLPNDSIHVVAQDDHALAEGMFAFLRGEVPPSELDVREYNRMVVEEFTRAISPSPSPTPVREL